MVVASQSRRQRRRTPKARLPDAYVAAVEGAREPRTENRAWEPEEDATLLAAVENWGSRWKMIAKTLAGRSEAMCRNRYQRIRAPLNGAPSRNKCTYCGELKRGHTCWAKQKLVVDGVGGATVPSPLTIDGADLNKRPPFAPHPARPSPSLLPPNLLVPSVNGGGFQVDPEVAAATQWCGGGAQQAPEPSPAGALGANALVHLAFRGGDDDGAVTDATMPPIATIHSASTDDAVLLVAEADGAAAAPGGEARRPLSASYNMIQEDDETDAEADGRGRTPTPPQVTSPAVTPCDEPAVDLAPPKPMRDRLAHSFDFGSLLSRPPAGDDDGSTMMLPLDAVTEALMSGDTADACSSQESIGTLPPTLSYAYASSSTSGAPSASERVSERLCERDAAMCDAAMPPLCKLPSWSRAPSFSCF